MKTTTHFEELRQIKLSQFESLFLHNLHKSDDNIMIVPTPDEVEQKKYRKLVFKHGYAI